MTDWQRIVNDHNGLVWRTAYRLVGNEADAADCLQETFISAWKLSRRQAVTSWPGLLRRLATHRALDKLRSRSRQPGNVALDDWMAAVSDVSEPVAQAQAAELSARLRVALTELPSKQAEVFCLRFLEELSYAEIAGQLQLKTSAVGVLLHRARASLRELLSPCDASETEVSP